MDALSYHASARVSGRERLILLIGATVWFLFLFTRLALMFGHWRDVAPGAGGIPAALALGALYDAVVALCFTVPAALLVLALPASWLRHGLMRLALLLILAIMLFNGLFLGVSEWLFWDEFSTRFNFIAVDYLIYTREVVGNINESYPVTAIISVLVLLTLALIVLARKTLARLFDAISQDRRGMARRAGVWLMLGIAAEAAVWAVQHRWKEGIANPVMRELAGNGPYEFIVAFASNNLDWNKFYLALSDEDVAREMLKARGDDAAKAPADPVIHPVQAYKPSSKPNVVLISMESMSADFMKTFGETKDITPNLDRLATESLFFARTMASGTRTVRGLEALTLSVPPTPGNGFVRRPGNEGMFSLGSVLNGQGYRSLYIYGGYGYFDNMNAFYSGNGYEIVDRTAVPKERIHHETIWGIADEDLFTQALETLDQHHAKAATQPVFAHIMTTSNHRPYTYPEGRIDIPSKSGRDGGVKYADWSIGDFLKRAAGKPWFDNTIFVIVADHQASSAGKRDLPVQRYHIPLMFYAPKLIQPQRIDRLAAQIDMAPTLLGMLGISYDSRFFGRDLLATTPQGPERAYISTYQKLGYIEADRLVILEPGRRARVEAIDWATKNSEPVANPGDAEQALIRRAVALYQGTEIAFRKGQLKAQGANAAAAPAGPSGTNTPAAMPAEPKP